PLFPLPHTTTPDTHPLSLHDALPIWSDALPNEEKALQHLLRAEATFLQITVAFGSRGGGGGGAGGSAGRDLASLFDLELDTEKKDRKSTRLNSSHVAISYAVFCLKKK